MQKLASAIFALLAVSSFLWTGDASGWTVPYPGGEVQWYDGRGEVIFPYGNVRWGASRGSVRFPGGAVRWRASGHGGVRINVPGFGMRLRW